MPNQYTVVFTPSTWKAFRQLPKKALGFRMTLATTLNKIENGDLLLCYLAERMSWCGVLAATGRPYESTDHIFSTAHGLPLIIDVDPICILDQQQEIPVKTKELWDRLDRFKDEDHRVNGWAVKVGLIRSLRKLSAGDADALKDAIILANSTKPQKPKLQT